MIWPATYMGSDVLSVEPNRSGAVAESIERATASLDNQTGSKWHDELGPAPEPGRPFNWTAMNDRETSAIIDWLDARHGRAVPFWLPSWQVDLELAQDVLAEESILPIRWVRYTTHFFPRTGARRHLCVLVQGQDPSLHHITNAADPGDGLTESLTITPAIPVDLDPDTCILSFLKFCRLDADLTKIRFLARGVAEAIISCREIPNEAWV